MKHFLTICILISICSYTQAQTATFPMKAGKVYYEIVDSSKQGYSKAQLYSMSKLWLSNQVFDENSFIQIDIPEAGLIAGRMTMPGSVGFAFQGNYSFSFSFAVISKDGRYKAQLYDFRLTKYESYALEYFLEQPKKYEDYKNALPKFEGRAYGFLRSIQHAMESVYDFMDF
jgi:hypothetical protein